MPEPEPRPTTGPGTETDHARHLMDELPFDLAEGIETPDLLCPSCGADLISDELFLSHRMCGQCRRHFSMPARERLGLLIDPGTFVELVEDEQDLDLSPGVERTPTLQDTLVAGMGRIGGVEAVVVILDDHLVGGAIGAVMADRIIHALETALTQRVPVLIVCAGGTGRAEAGPLAAIQPARLAATFTQLHLAGVPIVALVTHPTSGSIFSTLAAPADIVFAEPGAQVIPGQEMPTAADRLVEQGWIDGVVDRAKMRTHLGQLFDLLVNRNQGAVVPGVPVSAVTSGPATWTALAQARHPERPSGRRYADQLLGAVVELRGDRTTGDDPGTLCAIGRLDGLTVAVVAQDRANEAPHPARAAVGARKIARLARVAGRLELPLLIFVDRTQSDVVESNSLEASQSIAALSMMLAVLPVPIVTVAIGEIGGPVARALMCGDRQFMLENAVSTIPASKPAVGRERPTAMTAHEHVRLGLIDGVIVEPSGGAHSDPDGAIAEVQTAIRQAFAELTGTGQRRLLDVRLRRQRTLGQSTPEGLAAARSELWELQEWQRSLSRSIDDLRDRWENVRANQPRLNFQRPDLSDLTNRLRARRNELLERAGRGVRGDQS